VIISDIIPLRQRGTYQGYVNIVFATGMSLGAPLGGLAADMIGWRWAFAIQIPIIAVSTVIVLRNKIPVPPHYEGSVAATDQTRKPIERIDFGGAFTLVTLDC
jgi:MFS family permease